MRLTRFFILFCICSFPEMTAAQEDLRQVNDKDSKHAHHHSIERIEVTGSPFATQQSDTASALSVLAGDEKLQHESLSLGDSLNHLAGVDSIATGGQAGKPVIRGLSGNRIRVLKDGIAQDFQQFGVRHPPTLSALSADRIDVVRGPMSVLFGADAMGGVINVVGSEIPIGTNNVLNELDVDFGYHSNNDLTQFKLNAGGGFEQWGWSGVVNHSKSNNFATGKLSERELTSHTAPKFYGTVPFTDFKVNDINFSLGYAGQSVDWSLRYGRFDNKQNFLQPNELPTGQQLINQNLVSDLAFHVNSDLTLHGILSWQQNKRDAGTGVTYQALEPSVQDLSLALDRYQLKLLAEQYQSAHWQGQYGFEYVNKEQQTAIGQLVPDADFESLAAFIYERFENHHVIAELGLRYDRISQQPSNTAQQWVTNFSKRQWNALTGSMSLSWKVADNWLFIQRLGRGFRAPSIFDLYANGVHGGVAAFQQGDSNLKEEYALNKELAISYLAPDAQVSAAVFHNNIDDYIYQADTGTVHAPSNLPLFALRQGNAAIKGLEFDVKWDLTPNFSWQLTYSAIDSKLDELGSELPLMPADTIFSQLTWKKDEILGLSKARYYINAKRASDKDIAGIFEPFAQYDAMPFGTASTQAYNLFNAGLSGELTINNQDVKVKVAIENLFDEGYRDFLDTYKGYALGMGRNLKVQFSIPLK
ncbi:MAG: TonB-dependent receptor plug domain-containing protein [Pseudomonadota bacterium]